VDYVTLLSSVVVDGREDDAILAQRLPSSLSTEIAGRWIEGMLLPVAWSSSGNT